MNGYSLATTIALIYYEVGLFRRNVQQLPLNDGGGVLLATTADPVGAEVF